jgi:2-(1,2-epoxy-1,2-dihydrophenyl)acetyl-CoA isomerase
MSPVLFERDGDVAVLTLNEPQRLNPLTGSVQRALQEHLVRLRDDTSVRALVITGAGRGFCVGADLASMQDGTLDEGVSLGEHVAQTMERMTNRLIEDLSTFPAPVISAVNGAAAGAGVGVALAGDVVLAARSAYFYLPFVPKLGIVPDLGTTWFLPRMLGRARAAGLMLLGDRVSAVQAAEWGLVWGCVEDAALREQALALAHRLARGPAHAAQEVRAALDAAEMHTLREQLQYEASRQRVLIDRPEFAEGVQAFLEKREPKFGRR